MKSSALLTLAAATLFLGACTTYTVHDTYYEYDVYTPPPVRVVRSPVVVHSGYPVVVGHVWTPPRRERHDDYRHAHQRHPETRPVARAPAEPSRPPVAGRDERDDRRRHARTVPRGPTFPER
jgi:hypothetical protein